MIMKKKYYSAAILYCSFFLFFIVLNILTLYIADDYRYLFSFNDKAKRIESISDIILSMRAHRYNMNGRLVAHAIVQFFGMLPRWIFDILNSGVYVLQIAFLFEFGRNNSSRSNLMLTAIFCSMWLLCPDFAAVNLWQDGAINYLWSTALALLYLRAFIREYLYSETIQTRFGKLCYYCLAFGMGAYSETASSAAIFMAILTVLLMVFEQKKNINGSWISSIGIAFFGYITIYLSPAQWRAKSAEMTISALVDNFCKVANLYWNQFGVLLCIFTVALCINLILQTNRKQIFLGIVLFSGSVAANFILMFAQYYALRSSYSAFVYLLAANVVLLYPLLENIKGKKFLLATFVGILIYTVPSLVSGTEDIFDTYEQMKRNEAYIYECKENGIMDIEIPLVTGSTKYSMGYSYKYLDTEDPNMWPNYSMSYYYGVNTIIGIPPK